MASGSNLTPCYSHGGGAASGSVQGNGLPIWIVGCIQKPAFQLVFTGANGNTMTVFIEGNGGPLDNSGNPPATDWIDYTGGAGYSITIPASGSTFLSKAIPLNGVTCWRTRISAVTGAVLSSYIPALVGINNAWYSANRPPVQSATVTS